MEERTVAFDIETIADRSMIPLLPPVKPNGSLKDPAKVAADIAEKTKKQLGEMGLNPMTSMVCCFGWCNLAGESGHILLEDESGEAEKVILATAWEVLAKYDHYASFNGNGFDVQHLNIHSLKRRVRRGVAIDTAKYRIGNHTDLRMVLGNWDQFAAGTMDYYMKAFFGADAGKPADISGAMVQDFWDVGMKEKIGVYCQGDAEDTMKLYRLVKDYYL